MNNKIIYFTSRLLILLIISFIFFSNQILADEKFFYKWIDEKGVTHVTDNPGDIPQKHRNKIVKYKKKETSSKSKIQSYFKNAVKTISKYKYFFFGLFLILALSVLIKKISKKIRTYSLKRNTDSLAKTVEKSRIKEMSDDEFKTKSKEILIKSGYKLETKDSSFITRTNFIAERKGKKHAVHISTNINDISKALITEMEGEKEKFDCYGSIIVAKTLFDSSAIDLAKKTNCKLIDENAIAKAIVRKSGI